MYMCSRSFDHKDRAKGKVNIKSGKLNEAGQLTFLQDDRHVIGEMLRGVVGERDAVGHVPQPLTRI